MSEQVQVKIKGTVITARYGSLTTGAILRTDAAFARHLVEECNAAEYISIAPAAEAPAAEAPAAEAPAAEAPAAEAPAAEAPAAEAPAKKPKKAVK